MPASSTGTGRRTAPPPRDSGKWGALGSDRTGTKPHAFGGLLCSARVPSALPCPLCPDGDDSVSVWCPTSHRSAPARAGVAATWAPVGCHARCPPHSRSTCRSRRGRVMTVSIYIISTTVTVYTVQRTGTRLWRSRGPRRRHVSRPKRSFARLLRSRGVYKS